jgi:hypothetical protein
MSPFLPTSLIYLLSREWKLPSVLLPGVFPLISLAFIFRSASSLFVLKYAILGEDPTIAPYSITLPSSSLILYLGRSGF